jgi:hypothetical protein
MRALWLARLHGAFNVVGGLWPLVHLRSFEAVRGPKVDRWLVYTVAGLMMSIGTTQLTSRADRASIRQARRLGISTALALGGIDLVYVPRRRISPVYLVDAAAEAAWLVGWASTFSSLRQGKTTHG